MYKMLIITFKRVNRTPCTQRASPNKQTKSKEKAKKGGGIDVKQYENVKHERHTRQ